MIKRVIARLLGYIGFIVIVVLILSLAYVAPALPAFSAVVWGIIAVIIVMALLLGLGALVLYALSIYAASFAKTRFHLLEVHKKVVEVKAIERSMLPAVNGASGPLVPPTLLPDQPITYQTIKAHLQPGQLLIGIKADGTLRIGLWNEYKTVLVLGASSSGKTTTIIEKVVGAVRAGASIVPCDPHARKPSSLFARIAPLAPFLFPGATFAVEHAAILRNVRLVKEELERRVREGTASSRMLLLIVEEWNRLQRDPTIARELLTILEALGQEGSNFGVYVVLGAQQTTGYARMRKSVISYIVHRVDESEAKCVLPRRFASTAPELPTGVALVKDSDGQTEQLRQVLVTAQDIQDTLREMVPPPRLVQAPPVSSVPPPVASASAQPTIPVPLVLPDPFTVLQPGTRLDPAIIASQPTWPSVYHPSPFADLLPPFVPSSEQPTDKLPPLQAEENEPHKTLDVQQRLVRFVQRRQKKRSS